MVRHHRKQSSAAATTTNASRRIFAHVLVISLIVLLLSLRFIWFSKIPFEAITASITRSSQQLLQQQQPVIPCDCSNDTPPSSIPTLHNHNKNLSKTTESTSIVKSSNPLLFDGSETDQWKRELFARLDRVREVCGDLCNINDKDAWESRVVRDKNSNAPLLDDRQTFPRLHVPNVDCNAIIGCADMDASDATFPTSIPDELVPLFTVGNMTKYHLHEHFIHGYLGGDAAVTSWTTEELDRQAAAGMRNPPRLRGTYRQGATLMVREKLRKLNVTGKSVLIIGSERPWLEALCLGLGAAQITTLEYGRINSTHPKVKTLTPSEFREKYKNGTLGVFDAVVSHSSLEHSGLGRYGDALNPWGDILALARAWCVTKPGGGLYLGLPTGQDDIWFNIHRMYGKVRWPLITVNWMQLDGADHTTQQFELEFDEDTAQRGGSGFLFQKVEE